MPKNPYTVPSALGFDDQNQSPINHEPLPYRNTASQPQELRPAGFQSWIGSTKLYSRVQNEEFAGLAPIDG